MKNHFWMVVDKKGKSPTITPHLYATKQAASFWVNYWNDHQFAPCSEHKVQRVKVVKS